VSSADAPEESSKRSVQQLENCVGRAQFWCEEPACRGVQQNGGVTDSL